MSMLSMYTFDYKVRWRGLPIFVENAAAVGLAPFLHNAFADAFGNPQITKGWRAGRRGEQQVDVEESVDGWRNNRRNTKF